MIVGMDFGTTHSGMAVYDGQQVRLLPLEDKHDVARTAMYITYDKRVYIGREAIEKYYEENLNRPTRYERVHVGEIEQTFAELPTFVRDVYIEKDVLSPGRLFVSFKMGLSSPNYLGTIVGSQYFFLEDIIALYLYVTRQRAQNSLDRELDAIVLGRPVRFNDNEQENILARERLVKSAFRAGYKTVYLQYEPIAAAYYYEMSLQKEENVLVFDFGGGTLDMSILRLGNPHTRRVIANQGIAIAGDIFDQRIVRHKMPPHFGEGTTYLSNRTALPVPNSFYDAFSDWQTMLNLQVPGTLETLKRIENTSHHAMKIRALMALVKGQYGLRMYDVAEGAKRQLSERVVTRLDMRGEGFSVYDSLSRTEFERIIRQDVRAIEERLEMLLSEAGMDVSEIDTVIRTGGSSQIPVFVEMLEKRFGPEKVRLLDAFSSVTAGLGVIAHEVERGTMQLEAHHADAETGKSSLRVDSTYRVPPVDLKTLQRLVDAQEKRAKVIEQYDVLLTRNPEQALGVLRVEDGAFIDDVGGIGENSFVLSATSRHRVALLTSDYVCHTKHVAELYDLAQMGIALEAIEGFRVDAFDKEYVSHICPLESLKGQAHAFLISTLGYVQRFSAERLLERIDRPTSYQFGRMRGYPSFLLGAQEGDDLLLMSQSGRGVRVRIGQIGMKEERLLHVPLKGSIVGGVTARANDRVLIGTQKGEIVRMKVSSLVQSSGGSGEKWLEKGQAVAFLKELDGALYYAVTSTGRIIAIEQLDGDTGKVVLKKGEKMLTLFQRFF